MSVTLHLLTLKRHMRTLQSTMTWIVSFMSSAVKIAKTAISFNVFYELVISIYVYVTQANFTREKSMTFEMPKRYATFAC